MREPENDIDWPKIQSKYREFASEAAVVAEEEEETEATAEEVRSSKFPPSL